jgi:hypothetical protein
MIIKHVNGGETDSHVLGDADAELLEASQNLFEIYKKYNRQLFLYGEINSKVSNATQFFHVCDPNSPPEEINLRMNRFISAVDNGINLITRGKLRIGKME